MSSSRRTANEINILAMLDRHEAGGLPQRFLRALRAMPTMFWYGCAGVVALGLVGSLAWLAHDSGKSASVDNALAGAVTAADTRAHASAVQASGAASLSDAGDDPDAGPPAAGATIVDLAPTPGAGTAVPLQTAAHPPGVLPQRPAAHAGFKPAPRLAVSKATPAQAHAEARSRRPAAAPKTAPAAVDTDVALISAIIEHANRRKQAEEAAQKP